MEMKTTYIPLFLILSSFIACQNEKNSLDEQIVPNHQETITSLSRSTQNNVLDSVYVNTEGALVFETATAYMSITDTLLQFTNKELDQWDYILQCKEINALLYQTSFSVGTLPVWPYEIKNASTAQLGAEKDGYHLSHSFTFRYDNNNSPIDWCTCARPIGQELEFRELEKLSLKARIYPFAYGIAFGYKTTMPNLKY